MLYAGSRNTTTEHHKAAGCIPGIRASFAVGTNYPAPMTSLVIVEEPTALCSPRLKKKERSRLQASARLDELIVLSTPNAIHRKSQTNKQFSPSITDQ